MKKILILLFTGILIFGLFSCTPESLTTDVEEYQDCCGDEGNNPPPPPPPPPGS